MIPRIHPLEVQAKLAAGEKIHFLDVREPEEYAICRIGESPLIPLGDLAGRVHEIDDDAFIVVYCHHGVRSITGVAILQNAGITNAASMTGGIDAWSVMVDEAVPRY